jgi:D-serine deaminase-like pyridoxal phosphate-dependent protein
MGYEGHAMLVADRERRRALVAEAMERLRAAHAQVGGEVVSAGGTGSFDLNELATEIQAGSYALMDSAYAGLGLPFLPAFWAHARVISVSRDFAVADCGLKALGMDHGPPGIDAGRVLFCSDEHLTFAPEGRVRVGDCVRVWPAHVDPTIAYHERLHLVSGEEVLESWAVDLRGW